jgi:glutathione peroxidase
LEPIDLVSDSIKSARWHPISTDVSFVNKLSLSGFAKHRLGHMRKLYLTGMVMATSLFGASGVLDFTLNSLDGKPAPLAEYRGKVILIVNVASKCGYTPQYTGLEKIYEKYKDQGFVILGFPANNFGGQEPGTNEEIKTFCSSKYQVTFPMYSKVSVKGADSAPLYQFLTDKQSNPASGGEIKWNFTKFLVDRNGKVIARFEPATTPESTDVTGAIEKALK